MCEMKALPQMALETLNPRSVRARLWGGKHCSTALHLLQIYMSVFDKHSWTQCSWCNLRWDTLVLPSLPLFLCAKKVQRLTCEEDNELVPFWRPGWGSRCPPEWTDCPLDIRDSARLMMSPMRWMKPSFSDGRMNSLCTLKTKRQRLSEAFGVSISQHHTVKPASTLKILVPQVKLN